MCFMKSLNMINKESGFILKESKYDVLHYDVPKQQVLQPISLLYDTQGY